MLRKRWGTAAWFVSSAVIRSNIRAAIDQATKERRNQIKHAVSKLNPHLPIGGIRRFPITRLQRANLCQSPRNLWQPWHCAWWKLQLHPFPTPCFASPPKLRHCPSWHLEGPKARCRWNFMCCVWQQDSPLQLDRVRVAPHEIIPERWVLREENSATCAARDLWVQKISGPANVRQTHRGAWPQTHHPLCSWHTDSHVADGTELEAKWGASLCDHFDIRTVDYNRGIERAIC